jgi:hypothetical protein
MLEAVLIIVALMVAAFVIEAAFLLFERKF